jgi:hypothetical protein
MLLGTLNEKESELLRGIWKISGKLAGKENLTTMERFYYMCWLGSLSQSQ